MFIRTKGKYKADVATKEMFNCYQNRIEKKSIYDIEKKIFVAILKRINGRIIENIITTNYEFVMPFRLGTLSVKKFKTRLKLDADGNLVKSKIPVDYGKTLALWKVNPEARAAKKLVYFLNDHTDGFRYTFNWDKRTCNVRNRSIYCFKASRKNNRNINVALSTIEHLDFFEYKKYIIVKKV